MTCRRPSQPVSSPPCPRRTPRRSSTKIGSGLVCDAGDAGDANTITRHPVTLTFSSCFRPLTGHIQASTILLEIANNSVREAEGFPPARHSRWRYQADDSHQGRKGSIRANCQNTSRKSCRLSCALCRCMPLGVSCVSCVSCVSPCLARSSHPLTPNRLTDSKKAICITKIGQRQAGVVANRLGRRILHNHRSQHLEGGGKASFKAKIPITP